MTVVQVLHLTMSDHPKLLPEKAIFAVLGPFEIHSSQDLSGDQVPPAGRLPAFTGERECFHP